MMKTFFILLLLLLPLFFSCSEEVEPTYNTSCVTTEEFMVRGDSMEPIYQANDNITVLVGFEKCNNVTRGMYVLYEYAGNDMPVLKRVIAASGDTYNLTKNGTSYNLYVNGEKQRTTTGKPYKFSGKRYSMLHLYEDDYGQGLRPGIFMLLGNNPQGTLDSTRFGLVDKSQIYGVVLTDELE